MPGTTRYSATFDRTYEEEDRVDPSPLPNARRSRSQSWQANSGLDSRPYTPLGIRPPSQRSSSTDNGPSKGPEHIPTRTVAKTAFKAHNNPFQFVKVGTCPLYRKAEEQLKTVKEVKKQPDVLKEEEEEWQSNLDSWKSRRRKMSEDVFRRAEEIKQYEQEEQVSQLVQKKTKTFSEMVESRAHRGRSLSLCLISSPMELQNWEFENRSHKNGSCSTFSGESGENSTVNSEDEGVSFKGMLDKSQDSSHSDNGVTGNSIQNGSDSPNGNITPNNLQIKTKEGSYIDSGLESISSHRAGDTPDSGSDFSHDSNSSIDCDSPRAGVNILEEFNSKSTEMAPKVGTTNGFVTNENQINVADKIKHQNFDSKSQNYEKSIESENEMYVDDFEEIERQCEASCQVNGHIAQTTIKETSTGNATTTKPLIQNGTVTKPVVNLQINGNHIDKSNEKLTTKTRRKGVYAFNGTPPKQNSSEAFSVNSLFPLSPVTELPSPEDAKSIISTLSSGLSSVSKAEKPPKDITNKKSVSALSTKDVKCETSSSDNNNLVKESSVNEKISSKDEPQAPLPEKKVKIVRKVKKIKKAITAEVLPIAALDLKEESACNTSVPDPSKTSEKHPTEKSVPLKRLVTNKSSDREAFTEDKLSHVEISNSEKKKPEIVTPDTNTTQESVSNALQSKSVEIPTEKSYVAEKKTVQKPKNTIGQKDNTSAKQIEESNTSNIDSLSIVFQTQPNNTNVDKLSNCVKDSKLSSDNKAGIGLVADILPVEKVAEEMEKLILEQLEEEERAKELNSGSLFKSPTGSPEHLLIAPQKLAEPPKEKPPPPPVNESTPKDPSLKRVNSTKRIKKEIHKRRSNFLGIDAAEESLACRESSIPPPPALEEILKAEMELDRQSRLQIESASSERLTQEEKDIIQKEKEIIESLESEERRKQLISGAGDYFDDLPKNSDDAEVEEQIQFLENEQKRLELEKIIAEEQQLRLLEEVQLREREEFVRQQEAKKSLVQFSDPSLSASANKPPGTLLLSPPPPLSADKQSNISNTGAIIGDGKSKLSSHGAVHDLSKQTLADSSEKVATEKPTVPPKPFKKKEAIRKERERLRQEQEALQREREEHRRKLLQEQEELLKQQQNSHAPAVPVSRLGPISPLKQPSFSPPLTTTPTARDVAPIPSRSHHAASNGAPGNANSAAAELMGPAIVRQKMPPARKPIKNEAWGQQKVTSVRKQNQDSLTESRYNKNHWLIQEAEMRRIAELKERQRMSQLSCSQMHLAEDVACSNSLGMPAIQPPPNSHRECAVQESMWNYGQQPGVSVMKYPPPVVKEQLHTIYPQRTVSQQPPMKPSRVVPMERQEQMLSVSGHKRCSHCNEELANGAAMIIESLQLYYHIHCFQCCVCLAQLGNGSCGTDVRVRNQKLHCQNCYSNDEAGLKFSQV